MKKFLYLFSVFLLVFGMVGMASALPFSDTIDFVEDVWHDGTTYKIIDDTNIGDPYPFFYTHQVDFDPLAASIDSASLSIRHFGNSDRWFETWIVDDTGSSLWIGDLSRSETSWVTDTFILPESFYNTVSGASWEIQFRFTEGTSGWLDWDFLRLDESILAGEYSPVPEPATMFLLGAGILGLAGAGRKKFFKK
jgi:hypothetical protein